MLFLHWKTYYNNVRKKLFVIMYNLSGNELRDAIKFCTFSCGTETNTS